jgi:membrane-associated phospholipid phosphatase
MKGTRWLVPAAAAGLGTLLAFLLDPWAWRHAVYPGVYDHDWGRMLRVVGSLVFWLPVALALWLEYRARDPLHARKAWWLLFGPAIAGGVAELLKLLVRRGRPDLHEGVYVYRSFTERPFDSHDLGFPSSHVAVAFAGAALLARFHPRAGWVAYGLALGCAVTRVISRAHFVSDVIGAAIVGWAVGAWLGRGIAARRVAP